MWKLYLLSLAKEVFNLREACVIHPARTPYWLPKFKLVYTLNFLLLLVSGE